MVSVYSDFFFLNSVRLRAIGPGARQLGATAKLIAWRVYFVTCRMKDTFIPVQQRRIEEEEKTNWNCAIKRLDLMITTIDFSLTNGIISF